MLLLRGPFHRETIVDAFPVVAIREYFKALRWRLAIGSTGIEQVRQGQCLSWDEIGGWTKWQG